MGGVGRASLVWGIGSVSLVVGGHRKGVAGGGCIGRASLEGA